MGLFKKIPVGMGKDQVMKIALMASAKDPINYYTVENRWYSNHKGAIIVQKRLHVNDPSNTCYGGYFKNGKFRKWTKNQILKDNHIPEFGDL